MQRAEIIDRVLREPLDAMRHALISEIRKLRPGCQVVAVAHEHHLLERFSRAGHCVLEEVEGFASDWTLSVWRDEVMRRCGAGWFRMEWDGLETEFVQIQVTEGFHRSNFSVQIAEDPAGLRRLLLALDEFENDVRGAVLVFQDGCWSYSEELYRDIQGSTFDNLVLRPGMAEQIREDVHHWLESRDLYERHGVPWKRGMILVGPPGNGKTHMIKALVGHLGLAALYVRGFSSDYDSDAANIAKVFERARKCAPSMLILEDLDTLVTAQNRSFFLNELDGFALNAGILVVASANDPAKLDPALVNRPSRFDRRYVFELPEYQERATYLTFFTGSLVPELRLSEADADRVASLTEGFSFAYLKELVLSTMMAWASGGATGAFTDFMVEQVAPLAAQMQLDPDGLVEADEVEDVDVSKAMAAAKRYLKESQKRLRRS